MVDKEEVASRQLRANDVADTKARVWYNNGTTEEGVDQATLLSCDEEMVESKATG